MARQRPVSMLILSIFQFIFGGLSLCGGVTVLAGAQEAIESMQANSPNKPPVTQQKLNDYIEQQHPGYKMIMKAQAGFTLVLAVMMIVGGIGLLMVRSWGWWTTLLYAIGSILSYVFSLIYSFVVVLPAMSRYADEEVPKLNLGNQAQAMATGMKIGATGGAVIGALLIIYPIIVLILVLLPGVRMAYLNPTDDDGRGGDYYDSPRRDRGRDDDQGDGGWAED